MIGIQSALCMSALTLASLCIQNGGVHKESTRAGPHAIIAYVQPKTREQPSDAKQA